VTCVTPTLQVRAAAAVNLCRNTGVAGRGTETEFGRYEIVERIGRGMQGTVYKAHDPELDGLVAIKLLHTGEVGENLLEGGEAARPAIPLEARISSKLRHPNIVSIFDYGHFDDHQFLVFEYVEGQTLRQMLASQGSLSIVEVCRLAVPIIEAIAYAHSEGVPARLDPRRGFRDGRVAAHIRLRARSSAHAETPA
jgi:serine/threonine protein kinase